MDDEVLKLFLKVRERFEEIRDKVSLLKVYPELHIHSPGIALRLEEFEMILGFKPEFLYKSKEEVYGISVIYTVNDDVTIGIIAHEFAELIAREKGIVDHVEVDKICVEKGFGKELLISLQSILGGRVERAFIDQEDLIRRVDALKKLIR